MDSTSLAISCIILAGGKGRRFGRNKTEEIIGNTKLLQRVVSHLSYLSSDIILVTATTQSPPLHIDYPKLKIVTDIYHNRGPLGGIHAGLVASSTQYNLVVACDMPFLNPALLHYMIQQVADYDMVVPRWDNLLEPLHAVYTQRCLGPIEELLKQGKAQISQLLIKVRVRYINEPEIDQFDPDHRSFFNINTESDLMKAREMAGEDD